MDVGHDVIFRTRHCLILSKVMRELIGFGYWRSLYEPGLPDPAWFVDTSWVASERQQVADYLSKGHVFRYCMGFSWCRFRCDIPLEAMGAGDLTDGTYCWPEGLTHYILEHNLRLPDEVVQRILAQSTFPIEQARNTSPACEANLGWWSTQKGWNLAAKSFLSETDQEIKDFIRRYDQNKLFFEDYTEDGLRAIMQLARELKSKPTV
jgi:hypothetical protein